MSWYLSASLVQLFREMNQRWPNRPKAADGSIGDRSHQARVSDHNPDWSAGGVVRAIDITAPHGIDVNALLREVIGDPRVEYVIWNRRIFDRDYGFAARRYTGISPHTEHVHVSIRHARSAERDVTPWFGNARPRPVPANPAPRPTPQPTEGFLVTLGTTKENQIYTWVANTGKAVQTLTDKVNRTGNLLAEDRTAFASYKQAADHSFGMLEDKINRTGNAVQEVKQDLAEIKALVQQLINRP